jgi:hypothetical protein
MPLINTICPRCETPIAYDVGSQLECRICGFKEGGLIQRSQRQGDTLQAPANLADSGNRARLDAFVLAIVSSRFNIYLPPNRPFGEANGGWDAETCKRWNDMTMQETVRCARKLIEEIDK